MIRESNKVVYITDEYSLFKTNEHQPDNRTGVTDNLLNSIKSSGGNTIPAIIDGSTLQVIDGHRRLKACKQLGFPFYFIYVSGEGLKSIKELNSTGRAWTRKEYIASLSKSRTDYLNLQDWISKSKNNHFETVKQIAGYDIKDFKVGADISKINYPELNYATDLAVYISALMKVPMVRIIRGISKATKEFNIDLYSIKKKFLTHEEAVNRIGVDLQSQVNEEIFRIIKL